MGPDVVVGVLDVTAVVDEPDPEALVDDVVVLRFGWEVELELLEPGPDDPQAASTSASAGTPSPSRTVHLARCCCPCCRRSRPC
jgi:hypothetical protein